MDQSCQTSLPSIPRQRQQQQTTLPRIESLPPELLERIFFHSLCINLPRSSIHIARILSKRIIYKWLIRLAFSSTNPSSEHGIFTEDFLPAPLDFWALSTTERKSLQQSILECRWSTLDLFRDCQKEYVLHVLRRKTQDLVYTSETDQIAFDGISDYFAQPMRWDRAEQGRRGSGDLILKTRRIVVESPAPASPSTASSTTQDHGLDKRVAIWFHFGAVQIRDPSVFYNEIDLFRLPCPPALNERPRMPDKVLRSPWTEDKLEFLTLLSQETYLDEHNHSSERSYQVLRQLIRDRDFETFARLLELNVTAKDYSYPQKWPVKTRHFKEALRLAQGPNDPFLNLLYNNHLGSLQDRKLREMIVNRLEI